MRRRWSTASAREEAELEWIGRGLAGVGIVAGTPVEKHLARLLADGRRPERKRLVMPKLAVDPRGKLSARELVDARSTSARSRKLLSVAELLGGGERLLKRFVRLEKGLKREGEAHRVPVTDVDRLAEAAEIDLTELYEAGHLAKARKRCRASGFGLGTAATTCVWT